MGTLGKKGYNYVKEIVRARPRMVAFLPRMVAF